MQDNIPTRTVMATRNIKSNPELHRSIHRDIESYCLPRPLFAIRTSRSRHVAIPRTRTSTRLQILGTSWIQWSSRYARWPLQLSCNYGFSRRGYGYCWTTSWPGLSFNSSHARMSLLHTQHPRPLSKVYSFVPISGAQQHRHPRRRYEEIERMYRCGWDGCESAYDTLNHLNAHVTIQTHSTKRTPDG